MVAQEAHLGAEAFHFLHEIEYGPDPGHVDPVNRSHTLNPADRVNGLFRERHDPVRLLKDRPHKTGTAIDQDGAAGNAREVRGNVKAVKNIGFGLKDLNR